MLQINKTVPRRTLLQIPHHYERLQRGELFTWRVDTVWGDELNKIQWVFLNLLNRACFFCLREVIFHVQLMPEPALPRRGGGLFLTVSFSFQVVTSWITALPFSFYGLCTSMLRGQRASRCWTMSLASGVDCWCYSEHRSCISFSVKTPIVLIVTKETGYISSLTKWAM